MLKLTTGHHLKGDQSKAPAGRRFVKWVAGAEPVKTAQIIIIILQFNDFYSE